jgi:hypothetical protein
VAIGTAHRAMELLKTWGFITSSRGRRAIVVRSAEPLVTPSVEHPGDSDVLQGSVHEQPAFDAAALARTDTSASGDRNHSGETATATRPWAITVRGPDGRRYSARHVCEDINRPTRSGRTSLRSPGSKSRGTPTLAMTGSVTTSSKSANLAKSTWIRYSRCAGRKADVDRAGEW